MRSIFSIIILLAAALFVSAQTTEFTYQGNLKDGANAANGNYDIQFSLFSIDTGGSAIGTLQKLNVPVANGSFTVKLDFGAQFPGAVRYLELAVRPAGNGSFTTLAPRQQISNAPYAVRSLNAANADNATTATNAQQLAGVAANQYVLTGDSRLSDARNPLPGSASYIQNGTSQQASSSFNISGDGTAGGTLNGNVVNSSTQYNIAGNRILSNAGAHNLFAGVNSGTSNSTGIDNSFFGHSSGPNNTIGNQNAFFGETSGFANNTGSQNSFFGYVAGVSNTSGQLNAFFGLNAGSSNTTGSSNTMLGGQANLIGNNLTNATAIGANSVVSQSNSLVLGSILGLNSSTVGTSVGIGVSAPLFKLHVIDTSNAGLRVQTNTTGGTVASFGGSGAFQVDASGIVGGRFNILENGNVGINTPVPGEKLHVTGNGIFTGSVGIGTTINPNAPLAFPAALGKKITLYPGNVGDAGFGVFGNELRIASDNVNAAITFGFDDRTNGFTERMRLRGNGALALAGNDGTAGQVITSNGAGVPPQWKSSTNTLYQRTNMVTDTGEIAPGGTATLIPGLSQSIAVSGNAKFMVQFGVSAIPGFCVACNASSAIIYLEIDGVYAIGTSQNLANNAYANIAGSWLQSVGPGNHTIQIKAYSSGPLVNFGCNINCSITKSYLIVQVIPE